MPLSLDEFHRRLEASRLLSTGELTALDPSRHTTAQALAQQLVAQETLTKFQAETLLGEHPRPLVLDEYTILAPLGAGGMGEVFQARHRRMDRLVALKMLPAAHGRVARSGRPLPARSESGGAAQSPEHRASVRRPRRSRRALLCDGTGRRRRRIVAAAKTRRAADRASH